MGKAASLTAGPKFVKGLKVRALPRAQRAAVGIWIGACMYNWCGNPTTLPVLRSRYRILEKQGPADYRSTETEKLDSSAMSFAFQGF